MRKRRQCLLEGKARFLSHGAIDVESRFLREHCHPGAASNGDFTAVRRVNAGDNAQER